MREVHKAVEQFNQKYGVRPNALIFAEDPEWVDGTHLIGLRMIVDDTATMEADFAPSRRAV